MPPSFCLLPKVADEFLAKVTSGELDPGALASLPSAARRAELAKVVGEANAEHVNAQFESKLLLKHQQQGLQTWVEQTAGLKPAVKRDMLARVARMERVLEPTEMDHFLADLAKQKLGIGVTMEEAGQISALAKQVAAEKAAGNWEGYLEARVTFREYVASLEGHGPMTPAKAMVAFARGAALSFPTTIAKLTAVALSRVVTTPVEDAVALGVSKALPGLAEGSPRFSASGDVAMRAEAAAQAAMWTDGLVDAGRLLRNKASRLDLAHDDHATAHAWYEYMGSLHGALKEPIKRAEYARSLYRRTAEAAARGEDITDMTVKLRLSTEAFKDGQRAISMQDNRVAKAWNAGLNQLGAPDPVTGKVSGAGKLIETALRTDVPVMKAPTNIVAEASQYIGGILTGPAKAAWAYAHGIEHLKPIERDAIIREISKGAVGAALMGLYYFKHEDVQFGGYYQTGEKRDPKDVPADGLRVFGQDVPKQLLHHPMFQAAQFAATTARVSGSKLHAGDADPQGLASALGAAAVGLIEQVPIIGSLPKDMKSLSDPNTRGDFAAKKAAGVAVPGLVQWIAKQTDTTDAPRKPQGLTEHLKANIPGLRESVPLKSTVDSVKKERRAARQSAGDSQQLRDETHPLIDPKGSSHVARFDALVHSAFADSIKAITGSPSATVMGYRGKMNPDVMGEYVDHTPDGQPVAHDSIYLTPGALQKRVGMAPLPNSQSRRQQPEYVLSHELAHRMEEASPTPIDKSQQDSVFAHAVASAKPAYWKKNAHEHYAEAFANAVTFLRSTAGQQSGPDMVARVADELQQYEHTVPGTTLMVGSLLRHPVFAEHPLNQSLRQPDTASDATAVRRRRKS